MLGKVRTLPIFLVKKFCSNSKRERNEFSNANITER